MNNWREKDQKQVIRFLPGMCLHFVPFKNLSIFCPDWYSNQVYKIVKSSFEPLHYPNGPKNNTKPKT